MNIFDNLQTSLDSLIQHKLRSFLTVLGLIIGVASVIVMVALGTGAKEAVKSQFRGLGSNELRIFQATGGGMGNPGRSIQPITYEEAIGLRALPNINQVKVSLGGGGSVVRGRESLDDTSILGVPDDWIADEATDYIASGEFFTEYDMEDESRVAVIGQTVAECLFPGEDPIGQRLRVNRLHFLVIAVIKELSRPHPQSDPNNQVLVPITTAAVDLFGRDSSLSVKVTVRDEKEIEQTIEAIKDYFREAHDILPEQDLDVQIFSMQEVTKAQKESARTLALLLVGMAVVSLVVGGIGIMNVMLVSVTERTREIGVRMAVGACRQDIVRHFLIEAVTLSLIGGFLGVAVGILAIPLLTHYKHDLAAVLSWHSIPQAFGVALAVGIIFGLYPAMHASRLDPIEALRHE